MHYYRDLVSTETSVFTDVQLTKSEMPSERANTVWYFRIILPSNTRLALGELLYIKLDSF
jgi:hypothetical protein